MAEDKNTPSDIKAIDSTNLGTDQLAKAIEEATSKAFSTPKKIEIKNGSSEKGNVKTVAKEKTANPDMTGKTAKTTTVVIKNRPYVKAANKTPDDNGQNDAVTPKTEEIQAVKVIARPPSQTQKVILPADSSPNSSQSQKNETEKPAQSDDTTDGSRKTSEVEPEPKTVNQPVESSSGTNQEAEAKQIERVIKQAVPQESPESEKEISKPPIHDINQYHLPIKSRGRHYLNAVLAWTVLVLFMLAVGGYVLYQLEIIEISDFGF